MEYIYYGYISYLNQPQQEPLENGNEELESFYDMANDLDNRSIYLSWIELLSLVGFRLSI